MNRTRVVTTTCGVLAAVTVVVGWIAAISAIPGNNASGTFWMFAFAAGATLALVGHALLARAGRHGWAAVALALVAMAPTTFAYPLNVLVLVAAVIYAGVTLRRRETAPQP